MTQKFKRGNLVKILVGHQIWECRKEEVKTFDISPEDVGRTAIIKGAYNDLYGGGNTDDYSIIWMDTGNEEAWKHERELELVDEGGEHLFIVAETNKKVLSDANTNLTLIVKNWEVNKGKISSETVLFLFDKIGHKTSFLQNGEYFVLFNEWTNIFPLIDVIMVVKDVSDVIFLLKEGCPDKIKNKIIDFFNEVQLIKKDLIIN